MSKKFLSGINVTGSAALNTVADAGSNTGKFLVLDSSNVVSYRTASELYADLGIGSLPAGYTSTLKHEVKAGQTISKGQAVYVSSADGTNMIVTKASNASEATSSKTMGLLETSLSTNGKGNVITEGLLTGLNTNGATAGDPVWLGVDGALIYGLANKPVAPAHLVFIGIVTRANSSNGEIFVKVQNGFEMNELHNYQEGSVQNNQVIVYESATSLYKPKTIPTILGYTPVPDSRTLTINGTTFDLSANRAWTITTDASARTILRYVATASQTTFTISGGYTPGLVDVYQNGAKLDNATDFVATNGTTIVLTNAAAVNDVIEVYRYQTAFLANNALRQIYEFVATAGQTTFLANYNTGMVDVFYNGSKLVSTEYTAGNGTSIVLGFACNLNDTIEIHAYSYQVGAFTGQAQLNGTGFVKANGTTITYDNSAYLTTSAAASTYLTIATAASTYLTTSAAGTTYLAKSGGALTGALTIGNFDGQSLKLQSGTATGNTYLRFFNSTGGGEGYLGLFNESGTNYFLLDASSRNLHLNGGSNIYFQIAGNTKVSISSSGITSFGNSISIVGTATLTSNLYWNTGDGNNWYIQGQANGPTIRMKYHGGSTDRSGGLGWINNAGGRTEALTWQDTTVTFGGTSIVPRNLGKSYAQTSGGGTGTANVDTGITYNTGDFDGYGRGATYEVVVGANPNAGGSGAYYGMYFGILQVYTGWSGSAVTTYINYTSLAAANGGGNLTVSAVFWNGSSESSGVGVYSTGSQIRIKVSGYNSSYTGQDQVVYLKRIS
jgi:hypothetical protein